MNEEAWHRVLTLTTSDTGARLAELRYYPYGKTRYPADPASQAGAAPTTFRFTGQRWQKDANDLYFYQSRWYDPLVGRFLSADTIVQDPKNPQNLNRYSYVRNNPLRYVDPTGHFTEEEIMRYYRVKTWEEVLALFGKGGGLEGLWGWLAVLRDAKLGSTFGVYSAYGGQMFYGCFAETSAGLLTIEGQYLRAQDRTADGRTLYLQPSSGVSAPPNAMAWLGANGGYYVNGTGYDATVQYNKVRLKDADDIDWVGVGFDIAGVAADAVSFGTAGRVVNAIQVANSARKVGQALDVVGTGYDFGTGAVEGYQEGRISNETARSMGFSALGFFPGLGTVTDAAGAIDGLFDWRP